MLDSSIKLIHARYDHALRDIGKDLDKDLMQGKLF